VEVATPPGPAADRGAGHHTDRGPIAVSDPSPTFRRGLTSLLREAGMHAVEPPDLTSWVAGASHRAVILTIDGAAPLRCVSDLVRRREDVVLIALLPTLDGDAAATALRAGASTVAHRDEDTDRLLTIIGHALTGDTLLPVDLARLLAHTPPVDQTDQIGLTPDEVRWIGRLARNDSVAKVAADAGVSERTMYRRLDQVFRRIGVHNRIEAIAWATSNHLLDD
jgi:DNA-binding NarL/FixJ family response regulator